MRRSIAACTAVLALASAGFAPATPPATPAAAPAAEVEPATGRTMVVLGPEVRDVAATTQRLLAPLGLRPVHLYRFALPGFAVDADLATLAPILDDPAIAYAESDRPVHTAAQTLPSGVDRVDADRVAGIGSGEQLGVDIAILDTGIASHSDLRVVARLDCTDTALEASAWFVNYLLYGDCAEGGTDTDGHGTHVAGIAAARDNTQDTVGVAPGARLWAIKVLGNTENDGRLSNVVRGIDEVARRADTIEVANISLVANGTSRAIDDAISGATALGAVIVVAAGNGSRDAQSTTPANSPDAITVSAVTDLDGRPGGRRSGSCHGNDDRFATYSNHGAVVDIAAPGSCIESTAKGGGTTVKSGTSMAAPHVAGAAALRISQLSFSATSSRRTKVLDNLLSTSAKENFSCGYGGSPSNERLLDLQAGC